MTGGDDVRPPIVSVITIFLDAETFLRDAVESVLAQMYPHWELLLCDDGSTDGSTAIARAYADEHPDRVRYLAHPDNVNRGMSATRNLGLEHARGALIAFLDADDVWEPLKLERQVAILDEHPEVAMVYGPTLMWFSWTGDPEDAGQDRYRLLVARPGRVAGGRTLLARILPGRGGSPATCSVLVRKDAITAISGFENAFRGLFEDQAFFAKLFFHYDVYVMAESHDRYRQHRDSWCSIAARAEDPDLPNAARRNYLEWVRQYMETQPPDARLRRVVRRELWFQRHRSAARFRLWLRESPGAWRARASGLAIGAARRVLPAALRRKLWQRRAAKGTPGRSPAQPGQRVAGTHDHITGESG
jgi:glycosyltransferase involved in cell wall biosynthesis